jgi:magnesium chelatase accessory protein
MALDGGIRPCRIIGFNAALEPIRGNALLSPLAKLLFANPLTSRLVSFQARMATWPTTCIKATGSAVDKTRDAIATTCCCASLPMSAARSE